MKTKNLSLFSRICKCYVMADKSQGTTDDEDDCPVEEPLDKIFQVKDVCKDLILSNDQLRILMDRLTHEIKRGLSKETHNDAIVKCFTTYVQDLPNGTESGKFLALDLGGTNFRVLLITLDGMNFDMKSKIYAIPQSLMLGSGTQLFDHIAQCLALFIKELKMEKDVLPLGFTFSFPLTQNGLTKGILATWTKGFNCTGVVGEDVVALLEAAIAKRNDVKIDVCAILNDTTGTLMSCAWKNHGCRIGLIVGTGSNACYVEKADNVECAIPGNYNEDKPNMLINTEWGAFGEAGTLDFLVTEFDRAIDTNSINPGKQIFEKMISGMYMGELARLILEKLVDAGVLFNGKCPADLRTSGKFFTKYVSEIEADSKGKYTNCREVLAELGIRNATDQDCENVRYVCSVVSRRAAHLASAGIACLLNKIGENKVTVGIDGSVYRFHPHFHDLMTEKISQLQNYKFDLMLSEDGSGRGAALVAAVAAQKR